MNTSVILYILLASIGFGTVIVPMANAASFVCQPEWSLFRGNCYKVFNQMVTQRSASYLCLRQQASLVSIDSRMDNNFVNRLLDSADPANCKHFWIGLKLLRANEKDNIVGYCQWTQQWSTMPFACHANTREGQYPWAIYADYPPEPNNWAGEEECVVIGHNTGVTQVLQAGWVDWRCDLKAGFVCKKKAEEYQYIEEGAEPCVLERLN